MELTNAQLSALLEEAVRGMARVQARQEMLECVMRALIVESPPAHPLFWRALRTAKSDLHQRAERTRQAHVPEFDADAMALWNELRAACAPPASSSSATGGG